MTFGKKEPDGQKERKELLTKMGFSNVEAIIQKKLKRATCDDVLDALVAAYTAGRVAMGERNYATLPANPPKDSKGLRMEIVYPVKDY